MNNLILCDVSHANVGESVYDKNGKYVKEIIHNLDFDKLRSKGVEGMIAKATQGLWVDPAYEILMQSSPFQLNGSFTYIDYAQSHYRAGAEKEWGYAIADKLISVNLRHSANTIKLTMDLEENSIWEKLTNTPDTGFALNRALSITYYALERIKMTLAYWGIVYTNPTLTKYMAKLKQCPLWIADPDEKPSFYTWSNYSIHQTTWKAPGKEYGNYLGNPYMDLDEVKDLDSILVRPIILNPVPIDTNPSSEDSTTETIPMFYAKCICTNLRVRSSIDVESKTNIVNRISSPQTFPVFDVQVSEQNKLRWYKIDAKKDLWVCGDSKYMEKIS